MKKAVKILCLVLSAVLCFSSCKNAEKEKTSESTTVNKESISEENTEKVNTPKKENITLPCNFSDGFNPFFVKSYENIFISDLIYEPLFRVNKEYTPVPEIAKNIIVDGTSVVISTDGKHTCRGSSPIDANDIVYSFNLAKASFAYGGFLNGVESATVISPQKVEFTLAYPNIYIAGKLNFPIVKKGTADSQTDFPTGSGRYFYSENKLVNRENQNKFINLYSIGTSKSASDAFKIGNIDLYYNDLSDCVYTATSGKTEDVLLNNMVFLGFNSANGALDKNVRSAISACIDSLDIEKYSYEGHAKATKLPISPDNKNFKNLSQNVKGDIEMGVKILDRAGYIRYAGKAKTNGKFVLSLSLIVNGDNKYRVAAAYNIADRLNKAGFLINVSILTFEDYSERIASGNYDMYLGEIKLDGAGDIGSFFTDGFPYATGIDKTMPCVSEYFNYLNGKITLAEYYEVFISEYPFVPICFREGYVVSSEGLSPDISLMPFGMYKNF